MGETDVEAWQATETVLRVATPSVETARKARTESGGREEDERQREQRGGNTAKQESRGTTKAKAKRASRQANRTTKAAVAGPPTCAYNTQTHTHTPGKGTRSSTEHTVARRHQFEGKGNAGTRRKRERRTDMQHGTCTRAGGPMRKGNVTNKPRTL